MYIPRQSALLQLRNRSGDEAQRPRIELVRLVECPRRNEEVNVCEGSDHVDETVNISSDKFVPN